MDSTPDALMISSDLFFSSKVTGTAAELGFRVDVERSASDAARQAAGAAYRCIILDLSTPELRVSDVIAALPTDNRPTVIAFGPHVQEARLSEAREAGCDEVLPRSKFSASLPTILTRVLGPRR
jgi:CheY-like chemotaxis protein